MALQAIEQRVHGVAAAADNAAAATAAAASSQLMGGEVMLKLGRVGGVTGKLNLGSRGWRKVGEGRLKCGRKLKLCARFRRGLLQPWRRWA